VTLLILIGTFLVGVAGYALGARDGMTTMREALLLEGYVLMERRGEALGNGRWRVFVRGETGEFERLTESKS
jgi:hypothetical protein